MSTNVRGVPDRQNSEKVGERRTGKNRSFVSLRPAARFGNVLRNGVGNRSGGITVIRAPGTAAHPEVGIVAARRVGGAVRRNRAKRRLREALAHAELRSGTAYVVIASPDVVTMRFDELVRRVCEAVESGDEEERL